jgi:MoxR-like ATPase
MLRDCGQPFAKPIFCAFTTPFDSSRGSVITVHFSPTGRAQRSPVLSNSRCAKFGDRSLTTELAVFKNAQPTDSAYGKHHEPLQLVLEGAGRILLGKRQVLRLSLTCLLARGHLLIEDVPGVGKTTLAHALARLLGLDFQRVQFTSDLLPANITGVSIYEKDTGSFRFQPSPIFAQLVLADEINRATPKTQTALLEAMEEGQVTQDGESRELPKPFCVVATQNPERQLGTFALPESQLDRFLMRINIGYPDRVAERELLKGQDWRALLDTMHPIADAQQFLAAQSSVDTVHTADAIIEYVQAIVAHTRTAPECVTGLSPRAGLAILKAARAWALLDGREHVLPEDIQAILPAVASHRLQRRDAATDTSPIALGEELIKRVAIPDNRGGRKQRLIATERCVAISLRSKQDNGVLRALSPS